MDTKKFHLLLILPALLLAACATDMQSLLSEDDTRAQAIETLLSEPSARGEVVDRLLSSPDGRVALFRKIEDSEEVAGALVGQLLDSERGKAMTATRIASDSETTRTIIGMLMLAGGAGEILSREQAECLELGDALSHGNQVRTMTDLKQLGRVVEEWRKKAGTYPVCDGFDAVTDCLASSLPGDALADLRLDDAWGRPFLYHSDDEGASYLLISYATDGEYDGLGKAGPTSSYNADIVFADGDFVQWPGHILKENIH